MVAARGWLRSVHTVRYRAAAECSGVGPGEPQAADRSPCVVVAGCAADAAGECGVGAAVRRGAGHAAG